MPGAYSQESLERHFQQINKRLADIEAQLKKVSDSAGVAYDEPMAEVPSDVIELAQAGKTMDAVKRYREVTGAGAEEAMTVVGGL